MFVPRREVSSFSFEGCRLILPSVSVGNVAQLAVDTLINTLELPRVGHLSHVTLLPLVGTGAYSHMPHALHTAAEVYHSTDLKTTVVQLRTPTAKGCGQKFCNALLQWVRESRFSDLVLLTSTYAHERRDSQIEGAPFRYLLSSSASLASLHAHFSQDLHWSSLEPRSQCASPDNCSSTGSLNKSQLFLPGSGLARRFYLQCCSEGLPMVVLVMFCAQGDNTPEALELASLLDTWLKLKNNSKSLKGHEEKAWCLPPSWDLMYGGPSPQYLF